MTEQGAETLAHEDFLGAVEAVLMVAEEPVTAAELASVLSIAEHRVFALIEQLR